MRVIITPWKTIEIKWQITSRSILDYQQIYPVKLTSNEPYGGGPWGGALRSSLPMGGLWGPWVTGSTAYSIPGVHQGIAPHPWVGPRPMAPLLGEGGIHSREALLGSISVYISLVSLEYVPPQMAPNIGVLVGTSQESWENSILDIRVSLPWLLAHTSTCFFFRNRPPEESDNKRSGARRGEVDSSIPSSARGFWSQVLLG